MSEPAFRSLEAFARAVHRRATALRVIERTGAGVAVGCAFASVMLPVWWWQGRDATMISVTVLLLGATAGAVMSVVHRASVTSTLALVDEQLQTSDLFTTAWSLTRAADVDPDFVAVVGARAARLCQKVSPSELVLNRYGGRAWTFAGLLVLLTLTLSMLTAPSSARATIAEDSTVESSSADRLDTPVGHALRNTANSSDASAEESPRPGFTEPSTDRTDASAQLPRATSRTPRDDAPAGAGNGTTSTPLVGEAPAGKPGGERSATTGRGRVTSNGMASDDDEPGVADSSAGRTGLIRSQRVAPWQSSDWFYAQSRATRAIEAGRVPDAYRDVVRDYFQTDVDRQ